MESQCVRVLALLKGGPLTSLEAARLNPPIVHLPRRIKDLKDAGHKITCTMHYYRDKDGSPKKYGLYTIAEE